MQFRLLTILFVLTACLTGCESYDVTVNDRLVYTPKALFTDYKIDDIALSACLEQAIVDAKITAASQLTHLNCSHSAISSLQGLATFSSLIRLKLSSNTIRNLLDLQSMSSLQELYLDTNLIVDPVPLYDLTALRVLDLGGNPRLQCPRGAAMANIEELTLPAHCR
jgi:Leucine-rich repeat (LRR) protein